MIRIGRNIFLNSKHLQLTKKKYEFFLGLNVYEIATNIILDSSELSADATQTFLLSIEKHKKSHFKNYLNQKIINI